MRKFKHKYLLMTAEQLNSSSDCMVYMNKCGEVSCLLDIISIVTVENSDDWEEIVEKDWEVISVVSQTSDEVLLSKGNERFGRDGICSLKYMLTGGVWLINSVKHLPTNKVWTLKDKTQFGTIEKFEIKDDKCMVICNPPNGYVWNRLFDLSELTQPKEEKCYPKGIVRFKLGNFYSSFNDGVNAISKDYNKWVSYLINDGNPIYEVTNGTDNFKAGDKIVGSYNAPRKIEKFSIEYNQIFANYKVCGTMTGCKPLSELVKYEQPKVTIKYEQPKGEQEFNMKYGKSIGIYYFGETIEFGKFKDEIEILKQANESLKKQYDTLWNRYKHLLGLTK